MLSFDMRWEYTILVLERGDLIVQELNRFGDEGWEVIQIEDDFDSRVIYFKRLKER